MPAPHGTGGTDILSVLPPNQFPGKSLSVSSECPVVPPIFSHPSSKQPHLPIPSHGRPELRSIQLHRFLLVSQLRPEHLERRTDLIRDRPLPAHPAAEVRIVPLAVARVQDQ